MAINYSTLYLVLGQAANIIGVILAKPVSDKIGKKNSFLYSMLFAAVSATNWSSPPMRYVFPSSDFL
ncbi:MAG: hypothetical protein EOO20_12300 [Chryseobacterium sp.]|nr:MAG: hypothetical protein EOO20_12300 [Chryseobacterium sp.]